MKKLLVGFIFTILSLFVFVPSSYAKVMVQEKGTVTVTSKEIINDDLFVGASDAQISGTINGDVYIGSGNVTVDGATIKGNLFIGAGDVTITKTTVGNSLLVGAGNLKIDENSTIKGSLLAGSGMIVNKAKIGRNFFAGAGSIELAATTKIGKDFYYSTGDTQTDLVLPKGSTVSGVMQRVSPPVKTTQDVEKTKAEFLKSAKMFESGLLVISFLGALLVGFIAIKMHSNYIDTVVSKVSESVWSNLGVGLLVLILTVPLALIVMFTGVGASLSFIVLALFGIGVYMAKLVVSLALGNWISTKFNWTKTNVYMNFAMGLAIFFILKSIPVVGGLTSLVFTSVGMGVFYKLIRK